MENEDLKDNEQEKTIDIETAGQVNPETEATEQVNPEEEKTNEETVSEAAETEETQVVENDVSTEEEHDIPAEPVLAADDEGGKTDEMKLSLERISEKVEGIAESTAKTTVEIREMHKLYHNEYANRLSSMQAELERYREIERGRIFDGILAELAKLYSNNTSILDVVENDKIKKWLQNMFLEILQILESNGVSMQKSMQGDKRNTRHCQVIERIYTDNPELHDTVASSRSTGFYIENRSLVKEMVNVYLYSEKSEAPQSVPDEIKLS